MGKQYSECAICGKTIVDLESPILNEVIGGISYNFDTNQCVMMYKRFRSVYGDELDALFLIVVGNLSAVLIPQISCQYYHLLLIGCNSV